MSKSARALLFDLDGTLVDSAGGIASALNEALASRGLGPFDTGAVADMVGGGVRRLVERALARLDAGGEAALVEDMLAAFLESYRAAPCRNSPVFPHAHDTLHRLAEQGARLGVVTNKPDDISRAMLTELGLAPMLSAIVGSLPGRALKPAPDMLQIALGELGVAPAQALMIGDSAADVGAARAAGTRVVLLAHGYSHGDVAALGADAVVPGFADLPAMIDALQH